MIPANKHTNEAIYQAAPERLVFRTPKGLTREIVEEISRQKNEPGWMREKRLKAFAIFEAKPMPQWGVDLSGLRFDDLTFYLRSDKEQFQSWEEVPEDIKKVYSLLKIPEAEQKWLAGFVGQYESEGFYAKLKKEWEAKGVIFCDTDTALQKYPELVKQYFMSRCVPIGDHKFAALHGAVWSGGSFVYIPAGVRVGMPLQTYFRMNARKSGQFEHTLIIAEEGSFVHYIESCTAPRYAADSLHSAVVEIFVKKNAHVRYTTIQNWSKDVYNLNTKRAIVYEGGTMEWVGGSMGCLPGDALVMTNPEGPVPIKSIRPGTAVYSLDLNTLRPVKSVVRAFRESGVKRTYEIKTEDGRQIRASENHPFLVYDRIHRTLSWKPVSKISPDQYLGILNILPDDGKPYQIPRVGPFKAIKNNVRIPRETAEDIMWILGVYMGDGFIEKAPRSRGSQEKVPRRVYFAVPPSDNIHKKLEEKLRDVFGCTVTKKGICLTVSSRPLAELILALGFTGLASTKRLPSWVFSLPHAQKLAFIEGYFDADGHVRKRLSFRKRIPTGATFTSCNARLLNEIRMLMVTCGLHPWSLLRHTRKRPSLTAKGNREYTNYGFNLSAVELPVLRSHRPPDAPEVIFSRVISLHEHGEEPTYDIEVDGPSNFIANGIIVHNSKMTMLYPCSVLLGRGARADHINIAIASKDQWKDTGAKVILAAPDTSANIISKSIAMHGGRSSYRGLVKINPGAKRARVFVRCDALMTSDAQSDTYPYMEVYEQESAVAHEASCGRISEEALFYLRTRGMTEKEAQAMIVRGFIEPITAKLPMDYAVELNKLVELEMEGAIG